MILTNRQTHWNKFTFRLHNNDSTKRDVVLFLRTIQKSSRNVTSRRTLRARCKPKQVIFAERPLKVSYFICRARVLPKYPPCLAFVTRFPTCDVLHFGLDTDCSTDEPFKLWVLHHERRCTIRDSSKSPKQTCILVQSRVAFFERNRRGDWPRKSDRR